MKPIKSILPDNPFFLAPMEAVNCASFRVLCKKRGASLIWTDMIDVDIFMEFVSKHSKEEAILKFINPQIEERPLVIQLGGSNIPNLISAISILQDVADAFDYNVGCPLPYMLGKKGGCYLMKHPTQLYKIISEMRKHIAKPFLVKIRSGWDKTTLNAKEIALELEKKGVDAITIHPRTRVQKYQDRADWNVVRSISDELQIPVILSGDVTNAYMAHMAFAHTKCDYIMVGRAAKNNPSVFKELKQYFDDGSKQPQKPNTTYNKKTQDGKKDWKEFLELYLAKEKRYNINELRDHALWIARECKRNKDVSAQIISIQTEEELNEIMEKLVF